MQKAKFPTKIRLIILSSFVVQFMKDIFICLKYKDDFIKIICHESEI